MISDRYEIRPEADAWAVYDRQTTRPVRVAGVLQSELAQSEADDLADALNFLVSVEAFDPDLELETAHA